MQQEALKIVAKLQKSGFVAYFAGGAVRDIIMKREPSDIDIATNADPDEIEKLFDSTVAVGKQFGVIVVNQAGHSFDVATFRKDANLENQPHL